MSLPRPTVELIRAAGEEFDRENATTEHSIGYLVEHFPDNSHPPGVLLKAAAINQLYRTNIFAIERVADHILSLPIDPLLKAGDQDAVCRIANLKLRKASVLLSFATKYCNWHNFRAYPIFDRFADLCLWEYKKQDGYVEWNYNDLASGTAVVRYQKFFRIVAAFRDHYRLGDLTFKELDKFLWRKGKELAKGKKRESSLVDL